MRLALCIELKKKHKARVDVCEPARFGGVWGANVTWGAPERAVAPKAALRTVAGILIIREVLQIVGIVSQGLVVFQIRRRVVVQLVLVGAVADVVLFLVAVVVVDHLRLRLPHSSSPAAAAPRPPASASAPSAPRCRCSRRGGSKFPPAPRRMKVFSAGEFGVHLRRSDAANTAASSSPAATPSSAPSPPAHPPSPAAPAAPERRG